MTDGYRGVFGAFPYAFRASDSWLFRSYVVAGALAAAFLAFAFILAVVVVFGQTTGMRGGSLTLSRSFVALVGLLSVLPVVAPVLLVARARRRGAVESSTYDALLAVGGYAFLLSLYLTAIASMPETFVLDGETVTRPPASGLFAPVLSLLYAIPPAASPLVTLPSVGFMATVQRYFG
ncbi:hypothetical protein [Halolamina sp.]|jgi:hypothetical protein|uniref:hypothetical protein n=1 Tax=Halolamina sp. TaxID=1940283 RepID=UPI000223BFF2|nr:hypothetical protein Halar_2785 [halophilic archaeon DL31]